jgi:sporulation protein YlmC with PRC-barrel domain
MHMEEITRLANLPVYTREGTFVGNVKNLILDLPSRRIDGILVGRTNPSIVEEGRDVAIPYRWVQSFNDILLLRYFPERIGGTSVPETEGAKVPEQPAGFDEVAETGAKATPPTPAAPARRTATRHA